VLGDGRAACVAPLQQGQTLLSWAWPDFPYNPLELRPLLGRQAVILLPHQQIPEPTYPVFGNVLRLSMLGAQYLVNVVPDFVIEGHGEQ
jgi:hypothetical protein